MFQPPNPYEGLYRFPLCVTLLLLITGIGAISNGNLWSALSAGLLAGLFGYIALGHYLLYRKEETTRKNQRNVENEYLRQYRQFHDNRREQARKQHEIRLNHACSRFAQLHDRKSRRINLPA